MKRITVSVPDDIYRKARIKAAEKDTSVYPEDLQDRQSYGMVKVVNPLAL